jgi:hypothetical protein
LTGLPVPLRLIRHVPPQRREVASEAVTGAWGGEQALDFAPDEQASQPPDIALA